MKEKGLPIRLPVSNEALKPEIKCEYQVSESLKKIQLVQLDLLNELLTVCRKHDIKLSVFAGTMLGVIRHKGFIPWDDDIDVCMTRKEFMRLCQIAQTEFNYPYFFQTSRSDQRFFCAYARFRNSETTGLLTFNNSPDYNNGIFIDVFVMDGIPNNSFAERFQRIGLIIVGRLLNSYHKKDSDWISEIYHISLCTKMSVKFSKCFARLFPYCGLIAIYDKILSMFNSKAHRLGLVTHGHKAMSKYWLSKDELNDIVDMPFEGIKVPICRNYDSILKRIYGNYMAFPPVSERGKWHENIVLWEPDVPYKKYMAKI